MPVSIQFKSHVVTVNAKDGVFEWSGNDVLAVAQATQTMHENGWVQGNYLSDELFVAQSVARKLGKGEIIDVALIVNSIREGWVQLLRDHLMPDPGEHRYRLTTGNNLGCTIESRGERISAQRGWGRLQRWPVSGAVNVGDPIFLTFTSQKGKTWYPRVKWERIECIRFSYHNPRPVKRL